MQGTSAVVVERAQREELIAVFVVIVDKAAALFAGATRQHPLLQVQSARD
jgi:hypothetical protein